MSVTLTTFPAPTPAIQPIANHCITLFTSAPDPHSIADIASLNWMPPKNLFPTDDEGANRLLTRDECLAVMDYTARGTFEGLSDPIYQTVHMRRQMLEEDLALIDYAVELMLVNTALAIHVIRRDYPDHQLAVVMRDGLVAALPDFYLGKKLFGEIVGLNLPGMSSPAAQTPAQRRFKKMRDNLQDESDTTLAKIVDERRRVGVDKPGQQDIVEEFFLKIQEASPINFPQFTEHIADQIEESGINVARDIVLYETWGRGKSALLITSALRILYPNSGIRLLIGSSQSGDIIPNVQNEYASVYPNAMDGYWPFAEILDRDTGEPVFLMGREAIGDACLIESQACMLAAYNLAMRIEGGHDLKGIKNMLLESGQDKEKLAEFLFPTKISADR